VTLARDNFTEACSNEFTARPAIFISALEPLTPLVASNQSSRIAKRDSSRHDSFQTACLESRAIARRSPRRRLPQSAPASPVGEVRGRFAFNRNPRATNTTPCVPRRYEFIVYTVRPPSSYTQTNCTGGKLQRLYSSNGSCIAACAPLLYKARSVVQRVYAPAGDGQRGPHREHRSEGQRGSEGPRRGGREMGDGGGMAAGKRMRRPITPACTRLILICILIAAADNWRFRFHPPSTLSPPPPGLFRGAPVRTGEEEGEKKRNSRSLAGVGRAYSMSARAFCAGARHSRVCMR